MTAQGIGSDDGLEEWSWRQNVVREGSAVVGPLVDEPVDWLLAEVIGSDKRSGEEGFVAARVHMGGGLLGRSGNGFCGGDEASGRGLVKARYMAGGVRIAVVDKGAV